MGSPILVTGAAGFIGMHVAERLLARGDQVIGVDAFNAYYDPRLKAAFHQADLAIGLVLVAAVSLYVWHRVRGIRRNRA